MTYAVRHNRMLSMRLRDGRRWVLQYREAAWERALDEARHRSFLNTMFFAMTHMVQAMKGPRS